MTLDLSGPPLERLTHRLAETPAEFLGEPLIAGEGEVAVAALVNDLLARFGSRADAGVLGWFMGSSRVSDRNRLMLTSVVVWLLADDWFATQKLGTPALLTMLGNTTAMLAQAAAARRYIEDAERREELARTALAGFGYRPEGETLAQATDRLSAVSSTERQRLVNASREAEERARAIREALVSKAAEESADKWSRE